MSKTVAYCALHYGAEYLGWAARSVEACVDEFHVLYSDKPTYGHGTSMTCPETESQLYAELRRFYRKPLIWHTINANNESDHRRLIEPIAKERGADLVLWLDADEVWDPKTLFGALAAARAHPARETRVRFIHFWRSLKWACEDPCMPVRILNFNVEEPKEWYLDPQPVPVLHMGYAQSLLLTAYKQDIHGHKGEWRPEWWESKFKAWTPTSAMEDVHPTCGRNRDGVPFWTPIPVSGEVARVVREQLGDHPYFPREIIV